MFTLPAEATATLVERLLAKIDMGARPCHIWTGAYNIDGRRHRAGGAR